MQIDSKEKNSEIGRVTPIRPLLYIYVPHLRIHLHLIASFITIFKSNAYGTSYQYKEYSVEKERSSFGVNQWY
jgi:hypothetical protein